MSSAPLPDSWYRGDDLEGHKRGQYAAAIMKRGIQGQGWKLVVTGHSLGAGVAALLSLKLRHSFPGAGHADKIAAQCNLICYL